MFETSLESMIAHVFISDKNATIADIYGFGSDISAGVNSLSYAQASLLVPRMYRMIPNIRYSRDAKIFESIIKQIIFSFGPEFESIYMQR